MEHCLLSFRISAVSSNRLLPTEDGMSISSCGSHYTGSSARAGIGNFLAFEAGYRATRLAVHHALLESVLRDHRVLHEHVVEALHCHLAPDVVVLRHTIQCVIECPARAIGHAVDNTIDDAIFGTLLLPLPVEQVLGVGNTSEAEQQYCEEGANVHGDSFRECG